MTNFNPNKFHKYKDILLNVCENDIVKIVLNYYDYKSRRFNFYFECLSGGSFSGFELIESFCGDLFFDLLGVSSNKLIWNELTISIFSGESFGLFEDSLKTTQIFLLKDVFKGAGATPVSTALKVKLLFKNNFKTSFFLYGLDKELVLSNKKSFDKIESVFENTRSITFGSCEFEFKGISSKLGNILSCDISII